MFKYLVMAAQQGRATWENGTWLGSVEPTNADSDKALKSCPELHVYLDARGAEGWELVATTSTPNLERLYLKKKG
ncbi:MAG: hypothetical protein U0228_08985 [Myxococcaceae bacterium]